MNLNFMGGWMLLEVFAVIGQFRVLVLLDHLQRISERHFPVAMVMSVRLAIGRDMDELIAIAAV